MAESASASSRGGDEEKSRASAYARRMDASVYSRLQPRVPSFLADAILSWDAAIRFARDARTSVRACGVWSDPSKIEASFRAATRLGSHRDKSARVQIDISQVHHYMAYNGRFTRTAGAGRSEF